jgi:hypothetical protein
MKLSQQIMISKVLPEWGQHCEKAHPGCVAIWKQKLSPYLEQTKNNGALPKP